jgi:hypothetical protein
VEVAQEAEAATAGAAEEFAVQPLGFVGRVFAVGGDEWCQASGVVVALPG